MRVAVIGAGIVGGAIAFYLARRGADVTLIDAGEVGMGATSHSFAWINGFGKEPRHYGGLNRRSLDTWERFARLLDADIGLRWGGQLTWAATDEDAESLSQNVARLQSWGYVARMIDEAEMTRLEPGLRPGPVKAAAISDNDGHVPGTLAAQTCARRVREMGGRIISGSPVTGLDLQAGRVNSIRLSGEVDSRIRQAQRRRVRGNDEGRSDVVECDAVVLAAGVGTTKLAAMAGVHVPQEESPGVVVGTEPMPPILRNVAALYCPPVGAEGQEVHVRQGADGVVLMGEGSQESLARDDSPEHAAEILARASVYLPELESATPVPVPVGYRPMPIDGMPVSRLHSRRAQRVRRADAQRHYAGAAGGRTRDDGDTRRRAC